MGLHYQTFTLSKCVFLYMFIDTMCVCPCVNVFKWMTNKILSFTNTYEYICIYIVVFIIVFICVCEEYANICLLLLFLYKRYRKVCLRRIIYVYTTQCDYICTRA